jgi:hypothetical protein
MCGGKPVLRPTIPVALIASPWTEEEPVSGEYAMAPPSIEDDVEAAPDSVPSPKDDVPFELLAHLPLRASFVYFHFNGADSVAAICKETGFPPDEVRAIVEMLVAADVATLTAPSVAHDAG